MLKFSSRIISVGGDLSFFSLNFKPPFRPFEEREGKEENRRNCSSRDELRSRGEVEIVAIEGSRIEDSVSREIRVDRCFFRAHRVTGEFWANTDYYG